MSVGRNRWRVVFEMPAFRQRPRAQCVLADRVEQGRHGLLCGSIIAGDRHCASVRPTVLLSVTPDIASCNGIERHP